MITTGTYPMTDESYAMFISVLTNLQSAYRAAQAYTKSVELRLNKTRSGTQRHAEYTAAYQMATETENAMRIAIGALESRYQTEAARYRREHTFSAS
jgi:diphthamide synthase (EF-2-diphthine--ammonia ligase)